MKTHDLQELIYELQVHQIELKMQNEALHEAQAKLDTSRQKYRDLYDGSLMGDLTLDRQGKILEINLTAAKMLGGKRDELLGERLSRFIHPASQDVWYMHFRRALITGTRCAAEVELISALPVKLNSQLVAGQGMCRISMGNMREGDQDQQSIST
jgi:PAS domain S-box-containing protein